MDEEGDFSAIEFWGHELPSGKQTSVDVENEPPVFHMVHVTGCALGENPKAGPHVLKAFYQGKPIVLCTLEKGGASQCALDFGISSSTTFINAGPSPIFISGYITRSVQPIEGSDEEDEEETDSGDEDLEDSDAEPPNAIPLGRGANGLAKKRGSPFLDDEADESDDEDDSDADMEDDEDEDGSSEGDEGESGSEEDEDEEGDEFDRRLGAKSFGAGDPKGKAGARGGAAAAAAGGSSSEDEGDEGSEEEEEEEAGLPELDSDDLIAEADSDDEEDDESDEDAPPEEKKSTGKRIIPISTPQPGKKAKKDEPKAPASAPPKVQQKGGTKQTAGGSPEGQWLSAMVDFVKQQGKPVPIAALGTHVKRPDGVKAKLKAFVLAHADQLALNEQAQTVTVRK